MDNQNPTPWRIADDDKTKIVDAAGELVTWAFDGPARIYTVHLASDGQLDPPLPRTLANFVATAIKK